jgi:RNA polymerase sigma-70 factor (ECF subfamily)
MTTYDRTQDAPLMARLLNGEQAALADLYHLYGAPVFSLAFRVLNDRVLAEEVTQDVFMKVWTQAAKWDETRGSLLNWMLAITQFAAIDRLRKERRQPSAPETEVDEESGGPVTQDDWQQTVIVAGMLEHLPPEQRRLVDLAFYQGYSHSQIAVKLTMPLGTVKTRLRMALIRLRELYEAAETE